jgi:hypothetical protein
VAGIEQTTHWLACHLGDHLVVALDVQYLGTAQFGDVATAASAVVNSVRS